ncbi:MAG TPA: hypothetical protein VLE96_07115 [Chlamydiales bacterium]|nr:hypothetical protein [Chlamydiales bacterium]
MSIVSDVQSTIGSLYASASSTVSSATSSVVTAITATFSAAVKYITAAATATTDAIKNGWNFTASTVKANPKISGVAFAAIAAGAAYAGRAQFAAIPAAFSNFIARK